MPIPEAVEKNIPEVIKKIREMFRMYRESGIHLVSLAKFVQQLVAFDDDPDALEIGESFEEEYESITLTVAQEACKDKHTAMMLIGSFKKKLGEAFCKLLITCFFQKEGLTESDVIESMNHIHVHSSRELTREYMMIYSLLFEHFACSKKEFLIPSLEDVRQMEEYSEGRKVEEECFQNVLKAITCRLIEQVNALNDEELMVLLKFGHKNYLPAIADFVLKHSSDSVHMEMLLRLRRDKDIPERMELIRKTAEVILKELADNLDDVDLCMIISALDDSPQCLGLKQEAVKRLACSCPLSEELRGVLRYLPEGERNEIARKRYGEFCKHPVDYNGVNILCTLAMQKLERGLTEEICNDLLKMATCETRCRIMEAVSEASDSPEKLNAIAEMTHGDTPIKAVSALLKKADKLTADNKKRVEKLHAEWLLEQMDGRSETNRRTPRG